ncbi:MAG: signal peptidase I [Clostridia bacterium]|nr:signal peptidase I [Clostridia bacterium]
MDNSNNEEKLDLTVKEQEKEPKDITTKAGRDKEKKPIIREVFDWVEIIAFSLAFVLLMFSYVARQARVDGGSMKETFHDGESIIISDLFYKPKQGDIVVFQVPNSRLTTEPIIKRVIAVGGQTVYIDFDNWKVYVYDDASLSVDQVLATIEPLDEPYIEAMRQSDYSKYSMNRGSYAYPLTVEEGKIFCMGDNRNGSTDSRSSYLGQIDERYVLGKVLFRIWPFTTRF